MLENTCFYTTMNQFKNAREEFLKELDEMFPKKPEELKLVIKRFEEEGILTQADFRRLKEIPNESQVYNKVMNILHKYPELKTWLMLVKDDEYVNIGNKN